MTPIDLKPNDKEKSQQNDQAEKTNNIGTNLYFWAMPTYLAHTRRFLLPN